MSRQTNTHDGDEILVLLVLSQGAHLRRKILDRLHLAPRNCHQMAKEFDVDWWTIRKHLERLTKAGFVIALGFGNTRFYRITPKGESALKAVSNS